MKQANSETNDGKKEVQQVFDEIQAGTKTGHAVSFEYPSQSILGSTPTMEQVVAPYANQPEAEYFSQIGGILNSFIQAPILEDHFNADDQARDLWEKKISEEYGEIGNNLKHENKLRVNKLGDVKQSIDTLIQIMDSVDQTKQNSLTKIFQLLDARVSGANAEYKKLPTDQKRQIVKQYSLAAVAALRVLAGQVVTPEMWSYLQNGYKQPNSQFS